MQLQEGAVIGGRYRLTSLIGEGGMASVWRATDDTLQRPVAIKLLYVRTHRETQSAIDQFLREARLAASIQHRNVIHTVDFGVTEDHMPYMVMELLNGESLADRMARSPMLRMEEVVHIANLTLRGLTAVHDAGIVHRDLKPQNIFLQHDAEALFPKILDFGISRSLGSGPQSAIATQQGMIVGTPEYMAPEQARGVSDIDKRADIYAMGAIIYEGITGRVPFEAESLAELIVKIATTQPLPMSRLRPEVPPLLSECIAQAMASDRDERFADASVFRKALTRAAERSFGSTQQAFVSDSPVEHLPLDGPANEQRQAVAQLAAASAGGVWGGFHELEARAQRVSGAGLSAPLASAAVAKDRRSGAGNPVVSKPAVSAQPGRTSVAQPGRIQNTHPAARGSASLSADGGGVQVTHDEPLFGDNPLDTFAGEAGSLELDISGPAFPRTAGGAMPANQTRLERAESLHAPADSRARASRSTPSAAFWVLPVLLLVGLVLLLLAPSLFSPPLPDDTAAERREAENPATRESRAYREIGPRSRLGSVAPAQRDVTF
jgi:tRNA A-37 threonylcarbamoyl transferase component Bud32